jgi:hypothetical protein
MNKVFWAAGLAVVFGAGAVVFAMPPGGGPVGGHLNPGDPLWAASTGNPDDTDSLAVSEERTPTPPATLDNQPAPVPVAPLPNR